MIRVIKRYESRKLYDTEESRYVSLDDLALWVREGQEVRVIDNATSADVSAQILTQIIHDEGKRGKAFLPTDLLHELVRAGERAFSTGVEQVQGKVDRLLQKSIDRLGPVRQAREEMSHLRDRLSQLESTLVSLEEEQAKEADAPKAAAAKPATKKAPRKAAATKTATTKAAAPKTAAKSTTRKTTAAKPAATKTTTRKTTARKATSTKAATTEAASKTTETAADKA